MAIILNRTTFLDVPITVEPTNGVVFSNENKGHQFVISCIRGGELQTLTGTVTARFMRANNTTILIAGNNYTGIVDGKAVVTLPQDCYNVPGRFQMAVFLSADGATSCIYACVGSVQRTQNGELIDSGEAVPSLEELLAQIDACEQATADAQDAASHAVRYADTQTLTDDQKSVARNNISAASENDVADLKSNLVSRYTGKRISIIGDSIDTFNKAGYKIDGYAMYYPSLGVTDVNDTWWMRVLNVSGATLEVNASYSGSRVTNTDSGRPDFYDRVSLIGTPDIVFVTLGTNDSSNNVPLGDYDFETEYTSLSEATFRTAYIKGVKALQESYPDAEIVCIAERMNTGYRDSIIHIANTLSLTFIDASNYVGESGVHPGVLGMRQISSLVLYPTDQTLLFSEIPADGKKTGEAIEGLKSVVNDVTTIEKSKNLLNPNTWKVGRNINGNGMEIAATNPGRVLSEFIPVTPGKTYYYSALTASGDFYGGENNKKMVSCAFYASKDDYGSIVTTTPIPTLQGNVTAPEGANYFVFSFPQAHIEGSGAPVISLTEDWYPSSREEMIPWTRGTAILINQEQVDKNTADISDLYDKFDDITTIQRSLNLVNPNNWKVGRNINASGAEIAAATRVLSEFIPVTPGETYYFAALTADDRFFVPADKKIVGCAFYAVKDDYSSIVSPTETYVGEQTAPEGANYFVFSFPAAYLTGSSTPIISLTDGWYPTERNELVPWADGTTVLINQEQVDENTKGIDQNSQSIASVLKRSATVRTVSHQGYKIAVPKSTKWAYIAAKQHGFEIAENDINFSSTTNRTLFMWHDATFSVCGNIVDADHGYALYTDGTDYYWYDAENSLLYNLDYESVSGSVSEMTRVAGSSLQCTSTPWKLIKEIDVGAYYGGGEFAGTKVQTFEEWVLLCKQLGLEMYIDRKVNTEPFVSDLVSIVKKHGMLDHATWIINVTATIGQAIRDIDPNARLLLLTRPTAEQLPAIVDLAQSGRGVVYGFANTSTSAETVAEAIQNGITPEAYFVEYDNLTKDEVFAEIRRLIELGCTGLTIDEYFAEEAYGYLYDEMNAKLT